MGAQELLLTQLAMSFGYVRAVKDFWYLNDCCVVLEPNLQSPLFCDLRAP
jgi:hypothetical protein